MIAETPGADRARVIDIVPRAYVEPSRLCVGLEWEKRMHRNVRRFCQSLMVGICCWPTAVLTAEGERDLASETLSIFSTRCAGCHGPNLPKPRGRFGYVLDLARVAANPEIVVPSANVSDPVPGASVRAWLQLP